jgi:TPR repeat protein
MIAAPPVLRRTVGVLVLAAPLLLIFGPFPILRGLVILALGVLAVGLLILGWLDLSGTLAWRIIFATLAPAAWISADPGAWWLAFARRREDPGCLRGALDRAEAWGSPEATYEIALNWLSDGAPAVHTAGVHRLEHLAAQGHRPAQEALAGCMAWGQGTPLNPEGARAQWTRLGFGPDTPIPKPPPGLLHRRAQTPQGGWEGHLGRGLERAGAATQSLFVRSGPARVGFLIFAGGVALALLAIPLTMIATTVHSVIGPALVAFAMPSLVILALMALNLRRSNRLPRAARQRLDRAGAGEAEAAFQLGLDFDRGAPHAPRDPATARYWYRLAAQQGHLEAAVRLAELLQLGIGGPKDRTGARDLLQLAAAAGHPEGQRRLADLDQHAADLT